MALKTVIFNLFIYMFLLQIFIYTDLNRFKYFFFLIRMQVEKQIQIS